MLARGKVYRYYQIMKISLISCCLEEGNLNYPLGALCIQSALAQAFSKPDIVTIHHAYTLADDPLLAVQAIKSEAADILGVSVYLWNRTWIEQFAVALKKESPSLILFAGGPEVTANPRSFDLSLYTFLILGEGEETSVKAIQSILEKRAIEGEGIVTDLSNISYAQAVNLQNLPSPILSSLADQFLQPGSCVLWEMTRGCPFACSFCFESRGLRSVRSFPIDRLEAELDHLISREVAEVYILDPTFNMDKKRTLLLLELLASRNSNIHFVFEIRAELLDTDLADAFAKLNCSLQIGLQSIDEDVLRLANRRFNPTLFSQKIQLLNERGIAFGLDLIIGLPKDNLSAFCNSLDYAMLLKPSNLDIFPLALLPGTVVAEQATEFSIIHQEKAPYTIESSPTFPKQDIQKALKLKSLADLFFTKGQAGMWMGKLACAVESTPTRILLAFGSFLEAYKEDPEQVDIYSLQDAFVRSLLRKVGKKQYEDALMSFIELHQAIAFFHTWGESPVIELSYSLEALSELEKLSFESFIAKYPKKERQTLGIYAQENGEILFLPIE